MRIIIGIDVGGSTTKIVGFRGNSIIEPMIVYATDPVTSLFGAFGKYIYENNLELSDIEKVMLTGVGSPYITQPLYGLSTAKADEFLANGLGGMYLSGLKKLIVVSMGTGTSLVRVNDNELEHIGGIGIGGGTIIGLSKLLLDTQDISQIINLANQGDLGNIDLQIKDITKEALPGLPLDATASNFGKVHNSVKKEDIAAGIINMVLQCIGKSAILAALNSEIKEFVAIGNLTRLPQCNRLFPILDKMFNVKFIIPEHAEYATAIGVARAYIEKKHTKIFLK